MNLLTKTLALIVNRLSKFLGIFVKLVGYLFHFIFPKKRFALPKVAPAIYQSKKPHKIPKIFWQTYFTQKMSLPMYVNYLMNRLLTLDFEYRFVDDAHMHQFVKKYGSNHQIQAFEDLNNGAARADFWRLLVLYQKGGMYIDIDGHLVLPANWLLKNHKAVFVTEKTCHTNYFIATAPFDPIIKKTLDLVVDNILKQKKFESVYDLTGPALLDKVIKKNPAYVLYYRYVCIQGSFTKEYFQYLDRPGSKWIRVSKNNLLKSNSQKRSDQCH